MFHIAESFLSMKVNSKFYGYILVCLFGLITSGGAFARGINIEYAASDLKEGVYLVNARITFSFDDEVLNALKHGVSLAINIYVRLEQKRKWLWDKTVKKHVLDFELQYHPLSNNYLVINLDSGQREQFLTLDEALAYLGSIKNYNLVNKNELSDKKHYQGLIKAELNIESLPPPLKTAAYVSSEWQLESKWYEWDVR